MKITFTGEIGFNRDQITNTRDSHVWFLVVLHAHTKHPVFQRNLLWTFDIILLETSSSVLMHLKSFWHPSATTVSWRISCHYR
jgi:hypothetical protein